MVAVILPEVLALIGILKVVAYLIAIFAIFETIRSISTGHIRMYSVRLTVNLATGFIYLRDAINSVKIGGR